MLGYAIVFTAGAFAGVIISVLAPSQPPREQMEMAKPTPRWRCTACRDTFSDKRSVVDHISDAHDMSLTVSEAEEMMLTVEGEIARE